MEKMSKVEHLFEILAEKSRSIRCITDSKLKSKGKQLIRRVHVILGPFKLNLKRMCIKKSSFHFPFERWIFLPVTFHLLTEKTILRWYFLGEKKTHHSKDVGYIQQCCVTVSFHSWCHVWHQSNEFQIEINWLRHHSDAQAIWIN